MGLGLSTVYDLDFRLLKMYWESFDQLFSLLCDTSLSPVKFPKEGTSVSGFTAYKHSAAHWTGVSVSAYTVRVCGTAQCMTYDKKLQVRKRDRMRKTETIPLTIIC